MGDVTSLKVVETGLVIEDTSQNMSDPVKRKQETVLTGKINKNKLTY